ncbi:helix-turn-helix domain-containing protein [Bacillus sp. FJAT-50079]|uniref:GH39 family glycosyl hydrolase n=1 Tax=Bacillus sp. FJAT-50079 TaxID=2833577 RepID=UPI001BCA3242|nr:helix-turn-helix domain-containing protein [Bacillus sp. FJAT-50079]MBS4209411.1 helix-turn-helix domain-containing protein [Bacillus sp. FJAT-50079]
MRHKYEFIEHQENLPFKMFINSVDYIPFHWHKEIELIFVIQGSIELIVESQRYILNERDLIVINSMDVHKVDKIDSENVLLTLQIDLDLTKHYIPELDKAIFHCNSQDTEHQETYDIIRRYLAQMVWEFNKRVHGFRSNLVGILYLLIGHLFRSFPHEFKDPEMIKSNNHDMERLSRIIQYIDENYMRKLSLNEMAEREHLSFYYFSHFFKNKMGLSFKKYLTLIRLDKAATQLLETDKRILDISFDCGFANTKAFNKSFKDKFEMTPTEFRQQCIGHQTFLPPLIPLKIEETPNGIYSDVSKVNILENLFEYLPSEETYVAGELTTINQLRVEVDIDKHSQPYEPYWQVLTTAGRAAEGLRADWQEQFIMLKEELDFQYIRFHGIFNDEMMVYQESPEGKSIYNWNYVDKLYDFLIKTKTHPFVELGFMPSSLRRSDETIFWWKGNIAPPNDMRKWTDLVENFIRHCIRRYGIEEVRNWNFEVWNEPDLEGVCWAGTREEYFEFYQATANTIKSVSPELKVGGPALNYGTALEKTWLSDFLHFCEQNEVPIDFVSFHMYSEYIDTAETKSTHLTEIKQATFYQEIINRVQETLSRANRNDLSMHVTEWNFSLFSRNLIHDTMFMGPFIIKHVLDSIGKVQSLGFWTFTDIFEEFLAGTSVFHGGFGLMNMQGLKKPSYYAYYLLNKLGPHIIKKGEQYIITKKNEDIQILAFNYSHVDQLFMEGDWSGITEKDRYSVFEIKEQISLELKIHNISGDYKFTHYQLDRKHGSVFDEWLAMGAPESPSTEEINYLKKRSGPTIRTEQLVVDSSIQVTMEIPSFGVQLITLNKTI